MESYEEQLHQTIFGYAATAESINDLILVKNLLNDSNISEEQAMTALDLALQNIAEKYDTCADELEKFNLALLTNNEEAIEAARATLEYSIQTAELAEKMELSVDDIEDQARAYQTTYDALKD